MVAAQTTLLLSGVPMKTKALNGVDSLLSIVQMPMRVPVGTVANGEAGAKKMPYYAQNAVNHKPDVADAGDIREQQAQKARESEEQLHE